MFIPLFIAAFVFQPQVCSSCASVGYCIYLFIGGICGHVYAGILPVLVAHVRLPGRCICFKFKDRDPAVLKIMFMQVCVASMFCMGSCGLACACVWKLLVGRIQGS